MWVSCWNVSPREDGFPEGGARGKTILARGDTPAGYPHWDVIFVLLYQTNLNLVKYQWKVPCKILSGAMENIVCCFVYMVKVTDDWWLTHSPLGISRGNGGHNAVMITSVGHDGMANLCKPITAWDLHVRYDNISYTLLECVVWPAIYSKAPVSHEAEPSVIQRTEGG